MNKWFFQVILKKYVKFEGRASRKEFWMFVLFDVCISVAFLIVYIFILYVVFALINRGNLPETMISMTYSILFFLYRAYRLGVLAPSVALAVRRLHDTGQSGWMYCITLIPLIGAIWFVITMSEWPDEGRNKYGPNPINIESETSPVISYD